LCQHIHVTRLLWRSRLSLYDIAPGRLRLGIGPSHRAIIEDIYDLPQPAPLAHLREYVSVLRAALWEEKVDHHGKFFNVKVSLSHTAQVPVLISTLGVKAFQFSICSVLESRHYAQQQLSMDDHLHYWWQMFQ
jgi:Luciferase-like monooxygenase